MTDSTGRLALMMADSTAPPAEPTDTDAETGAETGAETEDGQPISAQWGLRERRLPRPLICLVPSHASGMYFEVYQVPEMVLTSILRGGGEWRWRLCAADGCVEVTSGSYVTEAACIAAIDILRGGAGTATMHVSEDA